LLLSFFFTDKTSSMSGECFWHLQEFQRLCSLINASVMTSTWNLDLTDVQNILHGK
jgi:hypothetical protein